MSAPLAVQFAPDFIQKTADKARAAARKVIAREVAREASKQVRKALEARLENALADTGAVDPADLLAAAEAEAALVLNQLTELAVPLACRPTDDSEVSSSEPAPTHAPAATPYVHGQGHEPAPFIPLGVRGDGPTPGPLPTPPTDGCPMPFVPLAGLPSFPPGFVPAPFEPLAPGGAA
jgi:hypothetical protein